MDFPDLSVSPVVMRAWVTASKVVRVDWENWLYSVGCELSCVNSLYSAYHSSINFFCAGLSSSYTPRNSWGATVVWFCAKTADTRKISNIPMADLNIRFSRRAIHKGTSKRMLHPLSKNINDFP